jgi:tyrosine-protein kinase Etk/Wzc
MSELMATKLQRNECAVAKEEIHLLDLLIVLAKHKRLVIGAPIVTGLVALGVSLLITPSFTSVAKLLPPQQQQSSGVAAMLGQLGGLAGAVGGLGALKNPNDLYVGLLESRTVADNLINRFKLKERYEQKTMDDTRKRLAASSVIAVGKKDGFITIAADDKEPQFAADLANGYVDELAKLTQSMALTEASQRRLFFEKQLKDARDQLANAEIAMRKTQEKTGLIQPTAQVQAIIINAAQVKGAIAAKEVQLNAMRTFAAGQNPELLRTQEELRGLQAQLGKLEKSQPSKEGDFMVPTGSIPEAGVAFVRSARDVKYYETIYELLAKQFELAKIDEAKESSLIQLLEKAIPAERKSKPNRALITLAGTIVGGIIGIVLAFMRSAYLDSLRDPGDKDRWDRIFSAWNGKRLKRDLSN